MRNLGSQDYFFRWNEDDFTVSLVAAPAMSWLSVSLGFICFSTISYSRWDSMFRNLNKREFTVLA